MDQEMLSRKQVDKIVKKYQELGETDKIVEK